jgi:hypothetical protein
MPAPQYGVARSYRSPGVKRIWFLNKKKGGCGGCHFLATKGEIVILRSFYNPKKKLGMDGKEGATHKHKNTSSS